MGYQCHYIALRRGGAESHLRVVEPCFRANTKLLSKEERLSVYDHGLIGTGWLEVHVNEHRTSRAVFKEKSGVELTDALPEIIAEIERRHGVSVAFAEERRRTEIATERARIEREAFERRRAEERKRRDQLAAQAHQWHDGQVIRSYVAAMAAQVSAGKMSADENAQWSAWALGVADEMEEDAHPTHASSMQPPTA
jgi:hypothetical protein